jgi:hypothetical protein
VSKYVLAAEKMPPRKPMTRRSPREPKLKEEEIGEGFSLETTRQFKYAPEVETVIKTLMKKQFIQPPVFNDIQATTR